MMERAGTSRCCVSKCQRLSGRWLRGVVVDHAWTEARLVSSGRRVLPPRVLSAEHSTTHMKLQEPENLATCAARTLGSLYQRSTSPRFHLRLPEERRPGATLPLTASRDDLHRVLAIKQR